MHPYEFMHYANRFYQRDMTGVPVWFYPLQYCRWNHFDRSTEFIQRDVLRLATHHGLDLRKLREFSDSMCVEIEDVRVRSSVRAMPSNVGIPFNTSPPGGWDLFELEFPEIVEWNAVGGSARLYCPDARPSIYPLTPLPGVV